MTLAAAQLGWECRFQALGARRRHLDPAPKAKDARPNSGFEDHIRAGICQDDPRYGTAGTKIRLPPAGSRGSTDQAAFLPLAAALKIGIEMWALGARWSSHLLINALRGA